MEAAWTGEKGRVDVTLDRLDVDACALSCSRGWKGRREKRVRWRCVGRGGENGALDPG